MPVPIARIYIPLAFGYLLSYFYRNANAIIERDLVAELGLSAGQLGLLTAAYFMSFAAMQIPLGLLLDRYGPRRTEAVLLLAAALGALWFSQATSFAGLFMGRLCIGFGVSACLMAAFKAYSSWFRPEQLPMINGWQMVAGGIGALGATAPLQTALHYTDWRGVFMALAIVTIAAAVLLWTLYPDAPQQQQPESLPQQWQGLMQVLRSRIFWHIAPYCILSQAAFFAYQGLWIAPWLRDVAGFDDAAVGQALLLMTLAMISGFFVLGMAATRLKQRFDIAPSHIALVTMSACLGIQVLIMLGITTAIVPLLMGLSFCATGGILPYAGLSQQFPQHLAGRVNTSLNLGVFVAAFALQWGTGVIIGLWPSDAGQYAFEGYRAAFGMLVALQALGLVWALRRRDK